MIAFICGSESWGGLEINQWRNALWLKQKGHRVMIFCVLGSSLHKQCESTNIPCITIKKHRKHFDFFSSFSLVRLIYKNKIKHVVIRDGYDMGVCTVARFFSFYSFRLHYFHEMSLGCTKKNLAQSLRFFQLSTWVCPLSYLTEETLSKTCINKSKIRTIPLPFDLSLFAEKIERNDARNILGLPKNVILFGMAARIDPQKGQLLLLKALLLNKNENVHVVLLGDLTFGEGNAYRRILDDFIEKNNLSLKVHFLPFMKENVPFYFAIDCLIVPSIKETFGMVTVEAMACGTPVIGSDAGGTPEILMHGQLGYLFKSGSEDDLEEKMSDFIDEPNKYPSDLLIKSVSKYNHTNILDYLEQHVFKLK